MKKKREILAEVEKTLQAFDDDKTLDENPFLFTRIMAERNSRLIKSGSARAFRPGISGIIAILVILINLLTLVYSFEKRSKDNLQKKLVMELKSDFQLDQNQNTF